MSKVIFLFILLKAVSCNGQQGFYIGGNVNNGVHWLYNKNDFINDDFNQTLPPNAFKFNNYQAGINGGVGLNAKMLLDFKLNYNHFEQDYRSLRSTGIVPPVFYNLTTTLHYCSFEGAFKFNLTDGIESDVIPFVEGGAHLSYLFLIWIMQLNILLYIISITIQLLI